MSSDGFFIKGITWAVFRLLGKSKFAMEQLTIEVIGLASSSIYALISHVGTESSWHDLLGLLRTMLIISSCVYVCLCMCNYEY